MKVVYIAGPFRAKTGWLIEQNVRRAEELGLAVSRLGVAPLIPHCNTRNFQGEGEDSYWLEATMELLRRCDAMILVPGWEKSSGTRAEVNEAARIGIPVFHTLQALEGWLTIKEAPPSVGSV